jgi:hypothetical protein
MYQCCVWSHVWYCEQVGIMALPLIASSNQQQATDNIGNHDPWSSSNELTITPKIGNAPWSSRIELTVTPRGVYFFKIRDQ